MTPPVVSPPLVSPPVVSPPVTVFGLLRAAGLDVALPLSALREVVPCPDELADLPVTAVGLLGAMTLRSTVVPVLDLVQVLGRPHERRRGQVVVVVVHEDRLVGLLVDEVRGLATVPTSDVVEVECRGADSLFSRTFHHPELGHVVSAVDADRLLALPGVPVVRLPDGSGEESVARAARRPTRSLTLVRCGAYTLAVDVSAVHSTIPTPPLVPSPADGPACLGVTPLAGLLVGVADLLALLGLGSLAGTALDCGLVLELPAGPVVLGVGAMLGLRDVPVDLVVPLPAEASPSPLLTEVADVPGVGPCLLVDPDALLQESSIVTLSRLSTPVEDAQSGAGSARDERVAGGPPHLSFRAGVDVATDLGQVAEVLAWPEDLVRTSGAPVVLGVMLHRGRAVPVLCLSELLGQPADEITPASRLLLVEVDGEPAALAVAALHAILPCGWRDEAPPRSSGSVLARYPLGELDGNGVLLPLVDLIGLVRDRRAARVPAPRVEQPALLPA